MVTHTAQVQQALEIGFAKWPGASTAECLARLAVAGAASLDEKRTADTAEWKSKVFAGAGLLSGAYGPGYLDEIRDGWPA